MSTQDEAAALAAAKLLVAQAEAKARADRAAEAQAQADALTTFLAAVAEPRAAIRTAFAALEAALPANPALPVSVDALRSVIANLDLMDGAAGSMIAVCEAAVRRATAPIA